MDTAANDARRALNRLRGSLEKAERELDDVAGALRHAEAADFSVAEFAEAGRRIAELLQFVDEQEQRLQDKVLHSGGIEPGRVRRGG
jgi:Cdc6-like AAA superfamily ATPase